MPGRFTVMKLFTIILGKRLIEVRRPFDGLRLGAEACQVRRAGVAARQDHLQRHEPIQLPLPRLGDDVRAAAAQLSDDFVARRGHAARGSPVGA
jgi:hypothetical protein